MPLLLILLILACTVVVVVGSIVAGLILDRRGSRGLLFAALVLLGAFAVPLLLIDALDGPLRIAAGCTVLLGLLSCFALRRPRLSTKRCWSCGHDFTGATPQPGTRCPACGLPLKKPPFRTVRGWR